MSDPTLNLRQMMRKAGRRGVDEARAEGRLQAGAISRARRLVGRASDWLDDRVGIDGKDLVIGALIMAMSGPTSRAIGNHIDRQRLESLAQTHEVEVEATDAARGIHVLDEHLGEKIDSLLERSPSFRSWWEEVASSEITVYVGTFEQIGGEEIHAGVVNYTEPAVGNTVSMATIAINLKAPELQAEMLGERFPRWKGEAGRAMEGEVLATIGHEFGHLVEIVRGGRQMDAPRCEDPQTLEERRTACSVRRENRVRAELGLPLDPDYGGDFPETILARSLLKEGRTLPSELRYSLQVDKAMDAAQVARHGTPTSPLPGWSR